jgi:hypothetical protein
MYTDQPPDSRKDRVQKAIFEHRDPIELGSARSKGDFVDCPDGVCG